MQTQPWHDKTYQARDARWIDEGVKAFRADETSLTNSQGGDLHFGVHEADGVASLLVAV